jgi:hypothetical protein
MGQTGLSSGSGSYTALADASFPYTAADANALFGVSLAAAIATFTLPAAPTNGRQIIIKDAGGTFGTYNLTVNGNGKNIDGAGTFVMNNNYSSITLYYNGTQWLII